MAESESNPKKVPPTPELPAWVFLVALFVSPAKAQIVSQLHHKWSPALPLLLLILTIASLCSGISDYRSYSTATQEIVSHISQDAAPLGIQNGRLVWSPELETPYNYVHENFAVQISENAITPSPHRKAISSGALQGLLFTPTEVRYWLALEQGEPMERVLLDQTQLRTLERSFGERGTGMFQPEELASFASTLCKALLPVVCGLHFLLYLKTILFCLIVFAISSLLFHREVRRNLRDVLLVSLGCSIPASIVAFLWYAAAPASWGFDNIYCVWDAKTSVISEPKQ